MAPKRFIVVRDTAPVDALRGAVLAMGNFDGVHRGHHAVIAVARKRASELGPAAFPTEQGRKPGFAVDIVPPFELDGRPVSSGPIRDALIAGRVTDAAVLLGFPWFVSGKVIH